MAQPIDKKELWVGWTRDAMARYTIPEEVEDQDELVDDMVEIAVKYADSMLDEFDERFSGGSGGSRKRGKRKPAGDED